MKRDGTGSAFSRPHYSPIGSPAVGQFLRPFSVWQLKGCLSSSRSFGEGVDERRDAPLLVRQVELPPRFSRILTNDRF